MYNQNTNAVQVFIRSFSWLVTFLLLGAVLLSLGALSSTMFGTFWVLGGPVLLFNVWLSGVVSKMFYILPEWQRVVLLRLGKFESVRGPGFFMVPPFIFSAAAVIDTRIQVHQVEATNTLTKDNVPTKVTAAIEYRVEDPQKAVIDVFDYASSVVWLSTEALKNTIGSLTLKDLLSEREEIAKSLKTQIDEAAARYGVDVQAVRITDIDTPPSLVEELAVIARSQRAAEAKRIQAEAEVIVAEKLAKASKILRDAQGMRLRELQVLSEMSKEESSMVIVYPYGDRKGEDVANAAAGTSAHKDSVTSKNHS